MQNGVLDYVEVEVAQALQITWDTETNI